MKKLLLLFAIICSLSIPAKVFALDVLNNCATASDGSACVNNCDLKDDQGKVSTLCSKNPEENTIYGKNGILKKIIQIFVYITTIASVMMITAAGIRYIVSSGEANGIAQAKNMIIYSVIGLFVAMSAQIIVSFILSKIK